jgi:site-specific recombinase XerD
MLVKQAVEEYSYATLRNSPQTKRWYDYKLRYFSKWCEQEGLALEDIKSMQVERYLDYRRTQLSERTGKLLSTYTLHGDIQVIKGFLRWCSQEDGFEDVVTERTVNRIEMPKVEKKVIEVFTREQTDALFAACDKEKMPHLAMRDRAILSVLLDTGIRAGELCGLTLNNVYLHPNEAYIKVHGKGNKWREVGLGKKARAALHRYITRYRRALEDEKHVFVNRCRKPLSICGLDQIIYRLGAWAHIKGVRCSPHTFRHTFAVRYLEKTGDIFKLSRLMGHSEVSTTEIYLNAVRAREVRTNGISVLDDM